MSNRKCLISLAIFLFALLGSGIVLAGISTTKHNLSATGPGTYKATSESQLCVYCHAPHNTNPASGLWNHALSGQTYQPYSSQTLAAAAPGQPTGSSKLCLSCHDGTVALGSVKNLPFSGGEGVIGGLIGAILGTSPSVLGTDLRNDHPISFNYDTALLAKNAEVVAPTALTGKFRPEAGQLQCSNCHDPHSDANPKFMLAGYKDGSGYGSPLCKTCHIKQYWDTVPNNSHRESTAQWNGAGTNPWHIAGQNLPNNANSTPKANGCESCHQPHSGGTVGSSQILKQDGESGVCLVCHNGTVASANKNIDAALNKLYVHPVKTTSGRHNPKRQADNKVREDVADLDTGSRHAECMDCHNPHAVSPGVSPSIPNVTNNLTSNVLRGVWGVSPTWPGSWGDVATYTTVQDTTYMYQVCLKCHSYYAFGFTPPADPYGQVAGGINTDQAREFNPNNASYHPVAAPGKNNFYAEVGGAGGPYGYSASLINGQTPNSTITCTECHSNSGYEGGVGPKGPHGTDVWPIVWGPYDITTGMQGTGNHLCFKCHNVDVYGGPGGSTSEGQRTGFSTGKTGKNLHWRHISIRDAPCTTCHAAIPHGWKRRSLLVFGVGTKDPAPYMNHDHAPIPASFTFPPGNADYGLNSNIKLDTIESGNWKHDDCHNSADGGVGICG